MSYGFWRFWGNSKIIRAMEEAALKTAAFAEEHGKVLSRDIGQVHKALNDEVQELCHDKNADGVCDVCGAKRNGHCPRRIRMDQ